MIVRCGFVCVVVALLTGCSSDSPARAACDLPVVPSALPASQVISLGTRKVGSQVSFNVPGNTASLTIVQQAKSANVEVVYQGTVLDNSVVPATISQPGGGVVYDDSAPDCARPDGGAPASCAGWVDPEARAAYFGGGSPATAAFTVPNTSGGLTLASSSLPTGQWSFVVNDYAYECSSPGSGCTDGGTSDNTYDVSVLLKPAGASANMDVAFYIVGNATGTRGTLTASTAPNEPAVQRMVSTFQTLLRNAGITVRTPAFYDVSDADKARFGTHVSSDKTGPCDELDQMFRLSAAHPGNTLNLFLVQSISQKQSGGGTVVGIDGTIPGPASLNGTVHSGAAVSLADLFQGTCLVATDLARCGADQVAYVAAHETGHFLGLFHTTEQSGDYFDPLADTGKCPCLSCYSGQTQCIGYNRDTPPFVAAASCTSGSSCAGGTNLMFWQLDTSLSTGALSSEQSQVMKASPLIQ